MVEEVENQVIGKIGNKNNVGSKQKKNRKGRGLKEEKGRMQTRIY